MQNLPEHVKLGADTLAVFGWVSALTGAITGVLGVLGAIGSVVWVWLRVYENKTFRKWLDSFKKGGDEDQDRA